MKDQYRIGENKREISSKKDNRPRICLISPYDVSRPVWGSALRIFELARALGDYCEVHLFHSKYTPPEFVSAKRVPLPHQVIWHPAGGSRRYSQVINPGLTLEAIKESRCSRFSLVICSFPWSGFQGLPVSLLCRCPLVVDEHNVEFLRFAEIGKGNRFTRWFLKIIEKFFTRRADLVSCVSEADALILNQEFGIKLEKILILPNGVDTKRLKPNPFSRKKARKELGITDEERIILFVGNTKYAPNREAVTILSKEIVPRILAKEENFRIMLIGADNKDVPTWDIFILPGFVERIEDFYNASDVVVAPLLSGGGTRYKVIEALACGKRVISTKKGAEGLEPSESIIICDEWDEFAEKIIQNWEIIYDEEATDYASRYGWDAVVRKLLIALDEMAI